VTEYLALENHPNVFVIGDAATVRDMELPGVAPAAMQMGSYVGKAIRARLAGRAPEPFIYKDKGNVATIGRGKAVADISGVRFHGYIAWWLWLALHLVYLIGFQNRLLVFVRWSWSFVTRGRGARLITGNERIPDPSTEPSEAPRAG
jgi:NADH dehydrogenase